MLFIFNIVFCNYLLDKYIDRKEYKLLVNLNEYISILQNSYLENVSIIDSLYDSINMASSNLKKYIFLIYDHLECLDELNFDRKFINNKYIFNLYLIVKLDYFYNNNEKNDCMENLNILSRRIKNDILNRKKRNYMFSGMIIIVIISLISIQYIENWAIYNIPELIFFYKVGNGFLIKNLIYIFAIIAIIILNLLELNKTIIDEIDYFFSKISLNNFIRICILKWSYTFKKSAKHLENDIRKLNEIKLESILIFQIAILVFCFMVGVIISLDFKNIAKKTVVNNKIIFDINVDNKENLEEIFLKLVKIKDINKIEYELEKYNLNKSEYDFILNEIEKRYSIYNNIRINFFYIFINSIIFSFIPIILLKLKIIFIETNKNYELNLFDNIISMLYNKKDVTSLDLLEIMESISFYYKDILIICINNLVMDEEKSYMELLKSDDNERFSNIVISLKDVDKIGLDKSFFKINEQIEYYIKTRSEIEDEELNIKVMVAKICAYAPFVISLGFYLIIPFIRESMQMFSKYNIVLN